MKKSIMLCFIVLILIMSTLLFTGCGDKDKQDKPSGSAVNNEISETIKDETAKPVFVEDDLGEFDFNGYEFNIWSCLMSVFYGNLNVEERDRRRPRRFDIQTKPENRRTV